ncbi:unnamed protein product, partial [Chrysoparadoxa australica]
MQRSRGLFEEDLEDDPFASPYQPPEDPIKGVGQGVEVAEGSAVGLGDGNGPGALLQVPGGADPFAQPEQQQQPQQEPQAPEVTKAGPVVSSEPWAVRKPQPEEAAPASPQMAAVAATPVEVNAALSPMPAPKAEPSGVSAGDPFAALVKELSLKEHPGSGPGSRSESPGMPDMDKTQQQQHSLSLNGLAEAASTPVAVASPTAPVLPQTPSSAGTSEGTGSVEGVEGAEAAQAVLESPSQSQSQSQQQPAPEASAPASREPQAAAPTTPATQAPATPSIVTTDLDMGLDNLMEYLDSAGGKGKGSHRHKSTASIDDTFDVFGQPKSGSSDTRRGLFDDADEVEDPMRQRRQQQQQVQQQQVQQQRFPPPPLQQQGTGPGGKERTHGDIDLEEARRRTALLTGRAGSLSSAPGGAGGPAAAPTQLGPAHPEGVSPVAYSSGSGFGGGSGDGYGIPTVYNGPADPLSSTGGNYFNEDLIRQRQALSS